MKTAIIEYDVRIFYFISFFFFHSFLFLFEFNDLTFSSSDAFKWSIRGLPRFLQDLNESIGIISSVTAYSLHVNFYLVQDDQ